MTAPIAEVYSAIQGEGPIVGLRQIFIRFYNCNLHCSWCDTEAAFKNTGLCLIEKSPGNRTFYSLNNPLTSNDLLEALKPHLLFPHHSVSLTGGEPLIYHKFLQEFLPSLKEKQLLKVYLETNGTLPGALKNVINWIDLIGMDWKIPSSTAEKDYSKEHIDFLRISLTSSVFVKIIITNETLNEDIIFACKNIADIDSGVPVILQPVTRPVPLLATPQITPSTTQLQISPPDPEQLLKWQGEALKYLKDVRVIPQTHKLIGQR